MLFSIAWVAGCAHTPLTCPARGGAEWSELRTPHFTLRTDTDRAKARALVQDLETRLTLLSRLAFPSAPLPAERLNVVLFDDAADYAAMYPNMLNLTPDITMLWHDQLSFTGFFRPPQPLGGEPVVVSSIQFTDLQLFLHETMHWLMRASLPQAPRWLNEGLAEFYQTMEIDYDTRDAILGRPPGTITHPDGWPTAEELVAADGNAFYHPKHVRGFYSAAWVMAHLLIQKHAKELDEYRRAVAGGEGTIQAWRTHLGADWAAWDRELRGHIHDVSDRPDEPLATRQPLPEKLVLHEAVTERALDDWEVHVLWADLRDSNGADTQADLDEALQRAPDSPDVRYGRGRLEWARHRLPEAEAEARAGLARRPGDPLLSLLLGWVLVQREERAPSAERHVDAIAPALEALRGLAASAESLDVIARYEALRDHYDASLDYAQRAVAKDPSCWRCYQLLAELSDEAHRPDDASAAAERAIALLPEQEISARQLEYLNRFRQHAKEPSKP